MPEINFNDYESRRTNKAVLDALERANGWRTVPKEIQKVSMEVSKESLCQKAPPSGMKN